MTGGSEGTINIQYTEMNTGVQWAEVLYKLTGFGWTNQVLLDGGKRPGMYVVQSGWTLISDGYPNT